MCGMYMAKTRGILVVGHLGGEVEGSAAQWDATVDVAEVTLVAWLKEPHNHHHYVSS